MGKCVVSGLAQNWQIPTVADEAHAIALLQCGAAQSAVGDVVAVPQPLQIRLHNALKKSGYGVFQASIKLEDRNPYLWMRLNHTVFANIDSMLKAKLVGHQALGALAQTHFLKFGVPKAAEELHLAALGQLSHNNASIKLNFISFRSFCRNFRVFIHIFNSHVSVHAFRAIGNQLTYSANIVAMNDEIRYVFAI